METIPLPEASKEQREIVQEIIYGNSRGMCVMACAGSGKTTTTLHIAREYSQQEGSPRNKILLLTYNARLKSETRARVQQCGLGSIMEVHSYHAFAVRYLNPRAYNDSELLKTLSTMDGSQGPFKIPIYDIVIVDEIQDMSPLYFRLVQKILERCLKSQLVTMGDDKQSIFQFNGADPRFLTLSPTIFSRSHPHTEWTFHTLSTTYRLTPSMVRFVHTGTKLPGRDDINHKIVSGKSDRKRKIPVRYIFSDPFQRKITDFVQKKLSYHHQDPPAGKYRPEDIFIIAPSIRSATSPLRILANRFTQKGIPIYVPVSDEERLDDDVVKNKVVFSTFHQVKGLERKLVLVFNFDSSYLSFYDKGSTKPNILPNTLYVAITRASEELIVIHDDKHEFLPCIKQNVLKEMEMDRDIEFLNYSKKRTTMPWGSPSISWGGTSAISIESEDDCMDNNNPIPMTASYGTVTSSLLRKTKPPPLPFVTETQEGSLSPKKPKQYGVTDLLRYLTVDVLDTLRKMLDEVFEIQTVTKPNDEVLDIEIKTEQQKDKYESVSEITGVAIPSFFEFKKTGTMSITRMRTKTKKAIAKDVRDPRGDTSNTLDTSSETRLVESLLKISTQWCSSKTGYHFKTKQIHRYDWISYPTLLKSYDRLDHLFVGKSMDKLRFEEGFSYKFNFRKETMVEIDGFVDVMDLMDKNDNEITEIKVVQKLQVEHMLQTAVYVWLARMNRYPVRKALLVNIRNSEKMYFRVRGDRESQVGCQKLQDIVNVLIAHKLDPSKGISDEEFVNQCTSIQR